MGKSIMETLIFLIPLVIIIFTVLVVYDPLLNTLIIPAIGGSTNAGVIITLFNLVVLLIGIMPIVVIALALRPPREQSTRF